ncbi:MAG: DUF1572 family protein [Chitinophagaceae bacterium]|nr:DUF1572 family protein [Chitinophagaceae bacterium]
MKSSYLDLAIAQFKEIKELAEKTFAQLKEDDFFWKQNEESNSIAAIIHHMSGNMLSRWTDFLTSDGEKPWRNRDQEFEDETTTRDALLKIWEEGWACLFKALHELKSSDLESMVKIRNQPLTVVSAINRQLTHYAYHVGQIVYVGKLLKGSAWKSLSIPKRQSAQYNENLMKKKK